MIGMHKTRARIGGCSLAVCVTLQACTVGPTYVRPHTELAPFHAKVDGPAIPAASASLDTWWTGFNDPVLVTVIQRALDQNLDLAASLARVQQARAVARGTGAGLLPSFDVTGAASAYRLSQNLGENALLSQLPGFQRNIEDYAVGSSASWEIDLFGGLKRGAKAANDEAMAAEADRIGMRVTVAADAADAYLQIRGYQARLAVALDQVSNDEHLVRLVGDRHKAGAGTGREVAQADALLRQARASVPPLRVGLEAQLNRLDVLMGVQPGTYALELGEVRALPSVPAIPSDTEPTDMLRRRPDIIAAERRLAASNERIGVAISDYYPKISLSGALCFGSFRTGNLFKSGSLQARGGGLVRWRLFDFGKVDAEVKQARGANAEALAIYRQAVLRAAEDVENALTAFSQTQLRVSELAAQVQALTKARELSEQAYRAGSISLTDVLSANAELLVARDQLDSERTAIARSAVAVFRALGGGWTPSTDPQSTIAIREHHDVSDMKM